MNNIILNRLKEKVSAKVITWDQANDIWFKLTDEKITTNALRCRTKKLSNTNNTNKATETYYKDGSVGLLKKITFLENEERTPLTVLKKLNLSPEKWELMRYDFGTWETFIKDHGLEMQTTVKVKVRPTTINLTIEEMGNIAKKVFSKQIEPIKTIIPKITEGLDDNKLLESPPLELHLGELSCVIDTNENYDSKIAQNRFNEITNKTIELQRQQKCGTLLLSIGGDFFNADNNFDTTNKGTQQHSDLRWQKMYEIGLELYKKALLSYSTEFDNIKVQYVPGNHDLTTSFYLFMAVREAFNNFKNIEFINDFKEVKCFVFGECGIFTTHGCKNINRTIMSLPAEFPQEYGQTKFRELHLGHLHSEAELKEMCGIIPRRVGSPKGRGTWEYNERFGTTIQKHELFIWNKNTGLSNISMISFEPIKDNDMEKKKVKQLIYVK